VNECDKTVQLKPYAEEFHEAFSQVIPRLIETLKGGSTATRELAFTTLRTLAQHSECMNAIKQRN